MSLVTTQPQRSNTPPKNGQSDEAYRHHVEQTFARYDAVQKERDQLKADLDKAVSMITQATVEISVLKDEIKGLRDERSLYRIERDQAVAQRAVYETLFVSIQAQMRTFAVPAAPLVKDMAEEPQQ
jgi:chromosome segregation ATPase